MERLVGGHRRAWRARRHRAHPRPRRPLRGGRGVARAASRAAGGRAGRGRRELADGARFGPFEALATPGHAPDHFALIAAGRASPATRCSARAASSSPPTPGRSPAISAALERLREREDLDVLCPGHGPPIVGPRGEARSSTSIIVSSASGCCWRRSPQGVARRTELLDAAWPDVPAELRPVAAVSLRAHLDKLEDEGLACPTPAWSARYGSVSMPPRSATSNSPAPKVGHAKEAEVAPPAARKSSAERSGASFSTDSPFPPIADYGFLSDCHTGALVASDGSIEWMCMPHFDSPIVFGAMLDRGAGSWRVGPYGVYVPAGRRYVPGTNLIETTWMTPQGWLRVVDALTIGEWHDNKEGSSHTRPPTDFDADHLLVRVIECIQGEVQVEMVCEPMLEYGSTPAKWSVADTGDEGGYAFDASDGRDASFACSATCAWASRATACTRATRWAKASGASARSPGPRASAGPRTAEQAEEYLDRTSHFWRGWLADGTYPDHPWRYHLERSALALKGLTFMPTGALVAAPTTSLPETPHGERNWDYRYCWMRDASFTLWGCTRSGSTGRPTTSSSTWPTSSATRTARCRSCTGSRARRTWRSRRSSTSRATRARARCGSATARTTSARTTCSARCSTRCTCTPRSATTSPSACGRCSPTRCNARRRSGRSPIRASGRRAESLVTTSPPS